MNERPTVHTLMTEVLWVLVMPSKTEQNSVIDSTTLKMRANCQRTAQICPNGRICDQRYKLGQPDPVRPSVNRSLQLKFNYLTVEDLLGKSEI